jgi:hypothetical protein
MNRTIWLTSRKNMRGLWSLLVSAINLACFGAPTVYLMELFALVLIPHMYVYTACFLLLLDIRQAMQGNTT